MRTGTPALRDRVAVVTVVKDDRERECALSTTTAPTSWWSTSSRAHRSGRQDVRQPRPQGAGSVVRRGDGRGSMRRHGRAGARHVGRVDVLVIHGTSAVPADHLKNQSPSCGTPLPSQPVERFRATQRLDGSGGVGSHRQLLIRRGNARPRDRGVHGVQGRWMHSPQRRARVGAAASRESGRRRQTLSKQGARRFPRNRRHIRGGSAALRRGANRSRRVVLASEIGAFGRNPCREENVAGGCTKPALVHSTPAQIRGDPAAPRRIARNAALGERPTLPALALVHGRRGTWAQRWDGRAVPRSGRV